MAPVTIELYLHGTPDHPLTAHSLLACRMLAIYGVNYTAHDITTDETARAHAAASSGISLWPQVFIDGEYVGGTEVLAELLRTHQLPPATAAS